MRGTLIGALTLALFSIFPHTGTAHSESVSCIPENDEYYPVPEEGGGFWLQSTGLTEESFNNVLDRVEQHYAPLLRAKGVRLDLQRLWKNGTVNASAEQRSRNVYTVNMYGGLARHPRINEDAFLLVACHELGHHLAGAPTYGRPNAWASTEGQSDYFATMKCFKELFTEEEHAEWYETNGFDPYAEQKCQEQYTEAIEVVACIRASEAGLTLANFFNDLRKSPDNLSYQKPDSRVVRKTDNNHPAAQCRLDTYFNGALCPKYSDESFDSENPFVGACNQHDGFTLGVRPSCWFNTDQFKKYLPKEEPEKRKKPWWWPFLT